MDLSTFLWVSMQRLISLYAMSAFMEYKISVLSLKFLYAQWPCMHKTLRRPMTHNLIVTCGEIKIEFKILYFNFVINKLAHSVSLT